MNRSIFKSPSKLIIIVLSIILIYIIWEPALPSGWIIEGMGDEIDPKSLSLDEPVTVRFELNGKGGGNYNIIVNKEKVEVVEGAVENVNLLLAMEAADFNSLMIDMVRGEADEMTFKRLVIANKLRFAGDIKLLEKLFKKEGGKK